MSNKPLVIYHGQCKDGFCSAWVFHRKYGEGVGGMLGLGHLGLNPALG